jgi:hypothetical protein
MQKQCECGEPSEWIDEYCQMCWEKACSESWWEMIRRLEAYNEQEEST